MTKSEIFLIAQDTVKVGRIILVVFSKFLFLSFLKFDYNWPHFNKAGSLQDLLMANLMNGLMTLVRDDTESTEKIQDSI